MNSEWKSLSRVQLSVTSWIYSPWNSPGQNTGVGSCSLLQGIFPTQGWNPGLLHCRWILYQIVYSSMNESYQSSHECNPISIQWPICSKIKSRKIDWEISQGGTISKIQIMGKSTEQMILFLQQISCKERQQRQRWGKSGDKSLKDTSTSLNAWALFRFCFEQTVKTKNPIGFKKWLGILTLIEYLIFF